MTRMMKAAGAAVLALAFAAPAMAQTTNGDGTTNVAPGTMPGPASGTAGMSTKGSGGSGPATTNRQTSGGTALGSGNAGASTGTGTNGGSAGGTGSGTGAAR